MKYNEFHAIIRRNGWVMIRQRGSHIVYVKKNKRYTVPNHGAKEMFEPLRKKIIRDMRLFF